MELSLLNLLIELYIDCKSKQDQYSEVITLPLSSLAFIILTHVVNQKSINIHKPLFSL